MLSDSPNRWGRAPPAIIAFIISDRVPGKALRVVTTDTLGFAALADFTRSAVRVAMPEVIFHQVEGHSPGDMQSFGGARSAQD